MEIKKEFSAEFRAKVALEALKAEKTISQISSEYGVHSNQIIWWKKELKEGITEIFRGKEKKEKRDKNQQELIESLYRNIGELKVENDWFKKKLNVLI